jgi:hypothetical protein
VGLSPLRANSNRLTSSHSHPRVDQSKGMTFTRSQLLLLIGLAAVFCGSGCVYRNGLSTYRVWADYNTLKTPALFIEETDHLPYHTPRVERFRWMYNFDTVAQRHGSVYSAGAFVPSQRNPPTREFSVPAPGVLPAENYLTPNMQIPPLPSQLPQQLKSIDDRPTRAPTPAIPIPQSPSPPPPPQRKTIDGPTAFGNHLIYPQRY